MEKPDKDLVGASTSMLVLAIVAKSPSYGYEIVRQVNAAADGLFRWQEGTVYPVLHKLEREGLLRTQWQESDQGRKRKYYYITGTGRERLQAQAQQWQAFNALVSRLVEVPNG